MAEVIKVDSGGGYGQLLQILLYFISFIAIIYALYKLFGLFKDLGHKVEEWIHNAREILDPSDLPNRVEQTARDIETIIKGTITGKQNTPEYNEAMSNLHYGGAEWEPGKVALPKDFHKTGEIKKYGTKVKPGETKTFAGGWYTETVVNNVVKCPYAGGELMTKEECLARKYGFSDYANFKAWLDSVKYRLKLEGKDPSSMSLDQLVQWGRKFDAEKKAKEKKQPQPQPTLERRSNSKCEIPADKAAKMSEKEMCEYVAKNCPEALSHPSWRRTCSKYGITPPSTSRLVPAYKSRGSPTEYYKERAEKYLAKPGKVYSPPVIRHPNIYAR